ncbi:MAG: succinylglutamate desuccinylase/aspartoacylase family protein [Firmicutes bacterium]|nr:succinylglutamate desuccinylase/aspartoacylase family protein [Bacillota bacterium]
MNFNELINQIKGLGDIYGVTMEEKGVSLLGRPIYAFHVGDKKGDQIIITAAIHAREWITAFLVVELVKMYANKKFDGGIWFVPLCNPDGVEIAMRREPLWKANARSVDLNVNFDADWGGGAQNIRVPGSENFIGEYPNSEPEVGALIDLTLKIKPKATIAYHSKGEVIYYGFEPSDGRATQEKLERDRILAYKVGEVTGYEPIKTKNSTGGYSDWVSMHLGVPALTIEVGCDDLEHPIGLDQLPKIFEQNREVPMVMLLN